MHDASGITHPEIRLAVAEMVLALFKDLENQSGLVDVECRLLYHAALIGTLTGRPMTVSKLAMATGMSRATVRRHLRMMEGIGAVEAAPGHGFRVKAAFANSIGVMNRMRVIERTVKRVCDAFNSSGGLNGQ